MSGPDLSIIKLHLESFAEGDGYIEIRITPTRSAVPPKFPLHSPVRDGQFFRPLEFMRAAAFAYSANIHRKDVFVSLRKMNERDKARAAADHFRTQFFSVDYENLERVRGTLSYWTYASMVIAGAVL